MAGRGEPETGVMISFADPTKVTRWWVACSRKDAPREVGRIVSFHPTWFAEHGIKAEYGACEGDTFTASEAIDTAAVKV